MLDTHIPQELLFGDEQDPWSERLIYYPLVGCLFSCFSVLFSQETFQCLIQCVAISEGHLGRKKNMCS